jgi:hypothetical protein
VEIHDALTLRKENQYLLISAKQKCHEILKREKRDTTDNTDNIDFLINLHFVLEIGLNTFFRHIVLMGAHILGIDKIEGTKIIDEMDLIEKVEGFIAFSDFQYETAEIRDEAAKKLSVIRKLKAFNETRNKLVHGHMIGEVVYVGSNSERRQTSRTLDLTSDNSVKQQIKLFKEIMEAISFFFDKMKGSLTQSGKENFTKEFLDTSFLN